VDYAIISSQNNNIYFMSPAKSTRLFYLLFRLLCRPCLKFLVLICEITVLYSVLEETPRVVVKFKPLD